METGRMVILLNLESLYESLYDALNQVSKINTETNDLEPSKLQSLQQTPKI